MKSVRMRGPSVKDRNVTTEQRAQFHSETLSELSVSVEEIKKMEGPREVSFSEKDDLPK